MISYHQFVYCVFAMVKWHLRLYHVAIMGSGYLSHGVIGILYFSIIPMKVDWFIVLAGYRRELAGCGVTLRCCQHLPAILAPSRWHQHGLNMIEMEELTRADPKNSRRAQSRISSRVTGLIWHVSFSWNMPPSGTALIVIAWSGQACWDDFAGCLVFIGSASIGSVMWV